MKIITPPRLWSFFMHVGPSQTWDGYQQECQNEGPSPAHLDKEQFQYLKIEAALGNIKPIMVTKDVDDNDLDAEDLASLVEEVLAVQRDDYQVIAWHGPTNAGLQGGAVCIIAYKHGTMVGWKTPAQIEALASTNHYAKNLISCKRMWGPQATIGALDAPGVVTKLRSVSQLIKHGLCSEEYLELDQMWPYMLTIGQEKDKNLEPAD